MGIVNINDDSFSGDGSLDVRKSLELAVSMVAAGADIIDVGGESARTNRAPVSIREEVGRVAPFIDGFHRTVRDGGFARWDDVQLDPPLLSINTWRPGAAAPLLVAGADILNDMGALPTGENARIAARNRAVLLIMHSVGEPKVPHRHVRHPNVMNVLDRFFEEKISLAQSAGLAPEAIVLDPGIDFAKQRDDNLAIFRHLARLARFQRPLLLPVSRKTVIGEVLGLENPADRDAGTIACIARGMTGGAHIFRVHNVAAAARAIKILHAIETAAATA